MITNNGLLIECGPADGRGIRSVSAILGTKRHRDKFDPDDSFKLRPNSATQLSASSTWTRPAHEYIESKILAAADSMADEVELFKPVVTMLDTVTPTKVEWLWPNKFAIGKNNILAGHPGLGKSLCYLHISAITSRASKFPDGSRQPFGPAGTAIFTTEDVHQIRSFRG